MPGTVPPSLNAERKLMGTAANWYGSGAPGKHGNILGGWKHPPIFFVWDGKEDLFH